MRPLDLFAEVSSILFLGAHPDDVEIGCGATIRRIARLHPDVEMRIIVLTSTEERAAEAKSAAQRFVGNADAVTTLGFRDGHLPWAGSALKDALTEAASGATPDVVLTHHRGDFHQDHRLVGELAWQLFRDATILEYEIPKWDGDLGRPNLYVPADAEDRVQAPPAPARISQSNGEAMVRRRVAARSHAYPGDGMQGCQSLRRGVPRFETGCRLTVSTLAATHRWKTASSWPIVRAPSECHTDAAS